MRNGVGVAHRGVAHKHVRVNQSWPAYHLATGGPKPYFRGSLVLLFDSGCAGYSLVLDHITRLMIQCHS